MSGAAPAFKITVLGSGTSVGVPTVGCHCAVCRSEDPRDKRLRPSILVAYEGHNVVIDTTPDFRTQILRAQVDHLDAVIYTHPHADHIMGLDDVRPFNFRQGQRIPIYAAADTVEVIQRAFSYIFDGAARTTYVPQIEIHQLDGAPFDVLGVPFTPVPILHGKATIFGFRFGKIAYLTDHSGIPESSMQLLQGLDVLFLDALRHKPHPTHSTVQQSIDTAAALHPNRTYFTHICHDLPHAKTELALPPNVYLAYDGLEIEVPAA
jgi:phosphoribosyl 1,2-cyclic phosphate phosphodiesterase